MKQCELVYETLKNMGIAFEVVEHPQVTDVEEADKYIEGMEGIRTKTLFLSNKKGSSCYLVVMDESKRLDMKKLQEALGEKRLHFTSEEMLYNKLGLYPGMVSLFGLINNRDHDVDIILDKDIMNGSRITFHPNDNTKTVFIHIDDMFRFMEKLEYGYKFVEV